MMEPSSLHLTLGFLQNLGLPEWVVIGVIVLLLFGHRLPNVARSLGKSISEFKSGLHASKPESEGAAVEPPKQ